MKLNRQNARSELPGNCQTIKSRYSQNYLGIRISQLSLGPLLGRVEEGDAHDFGVDDAVGRELDFDLGAAFPVGAGNDGQGDV